MAPAKHGPVKGCSGKQHVRLFPPRLPESNQFHPRRTSHAAKSANDTARKTVSRQRQGLPTTFIMRHNMGRLARIGTPVPASNRGSAMGVAAVWLRHLAGPVPGRQRELWWSWLARMRLSSKRQPSRGRKSLRPARSDGAPLARGISRAPNFCRPGHPCRSTRRVLSAPGKRKICCRARTFAAGERLGQNALDRRSNGVYSGLSSF
jgi:hypothetical protein